MRMRNSALNGDLISIITPSFNQSAYLEFCLTSVQRERALAPLEYIVFDGGSDDSSVAILQRHARSIDYWQSRPDGGQSNAINSGIALSKGSILSWINADDALASGATAV